MANRSVKSHSQGNFVVLVDANTTDDKPTGGVNGIGYTSGGDPVQGMIFGVSTDDQGAYIKLDAGIDSTNVSEIDESLVETEFQIEIDNRLGSIVDRTGKTFLSPTAVDDDHVATYIIRKTATSPFVFTPSQEALEAQSSAINGPIASTMEFKIRSAQDLRTSNFLFDRIGRTTTIYAPHGGGSNPTVKVIDSIVRVTGLTTGFSVDIPVAFAKL